VIHPPIDTAHARNDTVRDAWVSKARARKEPMPYALSTIALVGRSEHDARDLLQVAENL